jgi:two-component system NarL family sensor kinase
MSALAATLVAVTALAAIAAVLIRTRRMSALDASRARLAALALDAETREQRRLSETLHDTALQTLTVARQDLEEALAGDAEGLRRAVAGVDTALAEVRGAVSELHPAVTEQLGIGPALHALALQHARRRGFSVRVQAEREAAGVDDAVLLFLARELLANAGAHAGATRVSVRLTRETRDVVLEVSDDGCGFGARERAQALRNGHIGLAACQERVEALGGSFRVVSAPGTGARVRVVLPVARERRRVTRPEVAAREASPATP